MLPFDRREGHSRWKTRPSLEGLEGRDLLSVAVSNMLDSPPTGQTISAAQQINPPATSTVQVNPTLIPSFVNTLYPPTITTTEPTVITVPNNAPGQIGQSTSYTSPAGTYSGPQPTASEINREQFVVTFTGKYIVGSPRFSNQAATIHIYSDGKNVSSNQFLHGRAQMVIFPPANPDTQPTTADPVAGQTEGIGTFFAANFLQSSSAVMLDVSTPPGTLANDPSILDHGLPSHLDYTLDVVGSGLYTAPDYTTTPLTTETNLSGTTIPFGTGVTGAVNFYGGTGVVDIKYHPTTRLANGGSSGTCTVTVQGLNNLSKIFNALSPDIN